MAFPSRILLSIAASLLACAVNAAGDAGKPNIVVIMSDDQDLKLDSLTAQQTVRDEIIAKGVYLENHFVTTAQCCPSRVSYLRGQLAHNTNMTHVGPPGGGYDKFVATGEMENYLPVWLQAAGYRTDYIGKFMNGYNMAMYSQPPKGWDNADLLVNPYTYEFNTVVMSENGQRPIFYNGFHQIDVIRAKAVSRIEHYADAGEPFYIQISPASPHTQGDGPTVPCARHMYSMNDAKAPRVPNFNTPDDEVQKQRAGFVKDLPLMNDTVVNFVDWQQVSRLQGLMGVDEIVQDVLKTLEDKGILDNTYIIYTTDNGFHMGNHRQIGGKGFPFIEDTNIPMAIRGPGIPAGSVSKNPSAHLDMAPTYLSMAGVDPADFPSFLDGRSLLEEWKGSEDANAGVAKEVLNVEFWGSINNAGAPDFASRQPNNSYKTVRIVGEESAWLYSVWCTGNDTELYNTKDDPYELYNLAINPSEEIQKVMARLNGLLLVTKSCDKDACRNPWNILQREAQGTFGSLQEAMDGQYDAFFAGLPKVGFQACMDYQDVDNEIPYWPMQDEGTQMLGLADRNSTDNYIYHAVQNVTLVPYGHRYGTLVQRHSTLADIMKSARNVTDKEIGVVKNCMAPDYCGVEGTGD